jgi:hypothetical protein
MNACSYAFPLSESTSAYPLCLSQDPNQSARFLHLYGLKYPFSLFLAITWECCFLLPSASLKK